MQNLQVCSNSGHSGRASVCEVCNNLEWDALISDISTYAKKEYQKLFEQQGQIQLALRKWFISQSTHALPYSNESWLNPWKSKIVEVIVK